MILTIPPAGLHASNRHVNGCEPTDADQTANRPTISSAGPNGVNVVAKLQEYAQARQLPLPTYTDVLKTGEPHKPCFTLECCFRLYKTPLTTRGRGLNKRDAKREAAVSMLRLVEQQHIVESTALPGRDIANPVSNCALTVHAPPSSRFVPTVARYSYRLDPNLYAELCRCEPLMTSFRACSTIDDMLRIGQRRTAVELVHLIAERCKLEFTCALSTDKAALASFGTIVGLTPGSRGLKTNIADSDDINNDVAVILILSTTPAVCHAGHGPTFDEACEMASRKILHDIKVIKCCEKGDPFTFVDS